MKVLSLDSDDILFSRPKVKLVFPGRQFAIITNKRELEVYFSTGLKKSPNLGFTPVDYFVQDQKVILQYFGIPDSKIRMEKFEFNAVRLIAKSDVYYGVETQIV
jgi:hypothetical protein